MESEITQRPDLRPTDRRGFLTLGGATIAMGAVVAACGSGVSDDSLPVTGTLPPQPTESTVPVGTTNDITMLRTAQSIEALAAQTYRDVIESGQVTSPEARQAAQRIADAHETRVGLVGDLVSSVGGAPYTQPNPFLLENVVNPELELMASADDALGLLLTVENLTSQTEVYAAESLSTAQLRSSIVALGSSSARMVSVLFGLQGHPQVPFPTYPVSARAPLDARLPQ